MVSADDHQRLQNDFLVAAVLRCLYDIVQAGRRFDGPDIVIIKSIRFDHILHLCIHAIGIGFRAVAHEDDRGLPVVILFCSVGDDADDLFKVFIGRQERLSDRDLLESIGIISEFVHNIRIFKTAHQVSRLYDQRLNAVIDSTVKRFGKIVDDLIVTALYMVDNDLAGESAADTVLRERIDHRALDRTDRLSAAVIEAGSETYDQQLVLADLIRVQRIVQRSIAGVIVLFILFLSFLAFCSLCLIICICAFRGFLRGFRFFRGSSSLRSSFRFRGFRHRFRLCSGFRCGSRRFRRLGRSAGGQRRSKHHDSDK